MSNKKKDAKLEEVVHLIDHCECGEPCNAHVVPPLAVPTGTAAGCKAYRHDGKPARPVA